MKIYRWNDEYWYHDKRNWFKRWRQWIIWVGGWEKANGAGWDIFRRFKGKWELRGITPLSLLGHRLTFLVGGSKFAWRAAGLFLQKVVM